MSDKMVSIIQSQNLDVTNLEDVEKLKQEMGDSSPVAELQKSALMAIARHTASIYVDEAKKRDLDLNKIEDVEKLCKDMGEDSLSAIEVQGIALHAQDDSYFETLPADMVQAQSEELSDNELDNVAGGVNLAGMARIRQFRRLRQFRPNISPIDPMRVGGPGGINPRAITVKVVVKGNF